MKAHHSKKNQKVAVYSALFCLFLGAHPAFGAAEGVTVTSDVHLARATVGESAVLRVGTVNLEGSTVNGNMAITSKARVGEISADRSAKVNVASAHFHQAKVQGNAKIELAARTANITAGQGSTVSVGGFEIDTRKTIASSSRQNVTGGGIQIAAGLEQTHGINVNSGPATFDNSASHYLVQIEPGRYEQFKYCAGIFCETRTFGRDKEGTGYFTSTMTLGFGASAHKSFGVASGVVEGKAHSFSPGYDVEIPGGFGGVGTTLRLTKDEDGLHGSTEGRYKKFYLQTKIQSDGTRDVGLGGGPLPFSLSIYENSETYKYPDEEAFYQLWDETFFK